MLKRYSKHVISEDCIPDLNRLLLYQELIDNSSIRYGEVLYDDRESFKDIKAHKRDIRKLKTVSNIQLAKLSISHLYVTRLKGLKLDNQHNLKDLSLTLGVNMTSVYIITSSKDNNQERYDSIEKIVVDGLILLGKSIKDIPNLETLSITIDIRYERTVRRRYAQLIVEIIIDWMLIFSDIIVSIKFTSDDILNFATPTVLDERMEKFKKLRTISSDYVSINFIGIKYIYMLNVNYIFFKKCSLIGLKQFFIPRLRTISVQKERGNVPEGNFYKIQKYISSDIRSIIISDQSELKNIGSKLNTLESIIVGKRMSYRSFPTRLLYKIYFNKISLIRGDSHVPRKDIKQLIKQRGYSYLFTYKINLDSDQYIKVSKAKLVFYKQNQSQIIKTLSSRSGYKELVILSASITQKFIKDVLRKVISPLEIKSLSIIGLDFVQIKTASTLYLKPFKNLLSLSLINIGITSFTLSFEKLINLNISGHLIKPNEDDSNLVSNYTNSMKKLIYVNASMDIRSFRKLPKVENTPEMLRLRRLYLGNSRHYIRTRRIIVPPEKVLNWRLCQFCHVKIYTEEMVNELENKNMRNMLKSGSYAFFLGRWIHMKGFNSRHLYE